MEKGTIIYVGGFELPDKNAAAHRVVSNSKILRKLGYNVVFIDVDKQLKSNTDILPTRKEHMGFESFSIPYPTKQKEWFKYLTEIKSLKIIIKQYNDVKAVIAYNYPSIALLKLNYFCNERGIKVIADCTEWYSTKGKNIIFKMIKGFDSFLRMRIIQKRLDGLIVISKYLENYYKGCNNVVSIPPLVDLDERKWGIKPFSDSDHKVKFVYSGNPGINKDKINVLVEVLYKLKDNNYLFNVVGITKGQYIKAFPEHQELLIQLGERIRFYGRLSHIESLKLLKESDFCLFVREHTRETRAGFPTKFVESISSGVPVITTKNSDLEQYLTINKNGFFINIDDKDFVAEDMKKILNMNKEELKVMKENCLESKVFHYENYLISFNEFIFNVMKKNN